MDAAGQFVWCDDGDGRGRNRFALFRLAFDLPAGNAAATLHLFADTRYRLTVNGAVLGYGPARFAPAHPEFDTWDLRPLLRCGPNTLAVEVNHFGASSYKSAPGTRAGFVAWGAADAGGARVDFATPGAWRVLGAAAWDPEAPAFSFAQGPAEVLDARRLPAGWTEPGFDDSAWDAAVPLADASAPRVSGAPWGPLSPRSIPPLDGTLAEPAARLVDAPLAADEERMAVRIFAPACGRSVRASLPGRVRFAYAAFLHSPRAQEAELGLFWGPHYLNGHPLPCRRADPPGAREVAVAPLREGWNLLYGEPEVLDEVWGLLVGLPRAAGLAVRARPDLSCPDALRHTPPMPEPALCARRPAPPADVAALDRLELDWTDCPFEPRPALPAREVAWDRPAVSGGRGRVLVFDFGGEALGHPRVEFDAPAGTVLDVALDERLRPDGLVGVLNRPFVEAADRCVARGGPQVWEGFHPRGGRYLQVSVRPPPGAAEAGRVERVAIRKAQVPLRPEAAFACSDEVWNWTWDAGIRTLQACIEDAYVDCPWREQGTYLGDALVEMHVHRVFSPDLRVARRCLRLWAHSQRPDGQIPACAPSWIGHPLGDFTLVWVLALHDYLRLGGDAGLAAELWPAVERLWASPLWRAAPSGLWSAEGLNLFIDWGATPESRRGPENAALNALRYRALRCSAALARAAGRPPCEAEAFGAAAEAVGRAFRERLWDAGRGCFAAGRAADGARAASPSLHANVLALRFGLAGADQLEAVRRHVADGLAANPDAALGDEANGSLQPYFLFFALPAAYAAGHAALAERAVREHYGPMRDSGAWTLWEALSRGMRGEGSLCHAWSCAPSYAAMRHVLGVTLPDPAAPDRLVVAPDSTFDWARGRYPHARGPVEVAWERDATRLRLQVAAPPGVEVVCAPAGPLAALRLEARVGRS